MIKYTICPEQPLYNFSNEHVSLDDKKKYLEIEFQQLEKRGLEELIHHPRPGQRIFLYSVDLDSDECCIFFKCTGVKKGHFIQRIEMKSGFHLHSNSLEFTFE